MAHRLAPFTSVKSLLSVVSASASAVLQSFSQTGPLPCPSRYSLRCHKGKMVTTEPVERDKPAINNIDKRAQDLPTASIIRPGGGVTASMGKDISEGFETASEGDEDSERVGVNCEFHDQHDKEGKREEQAESLKEDAYEDALDDDQLEQRALAQANVSKVEGNTLFMDGHFEDALLKYNLALEVAPQMPSSVELRSICHANRAMCYLKLGKYEETIKQCTDALDLNPTYMKAIFRRGEAYEKLERYEDAIADMKKILELDSSNDQARRTIVRLEPLAREKMEKMKEEMIGKLKDVGNSLLGHFGMSVDNFKAVKDPNTGSYSISFQ